jgi:type II secretory pathway pseudopilin PulG
MKQLLLSLINGDCRTRARCEVSRAAHSRQAARGFTLAELLVGFMLFGVVALSMVSFSTQVIYDVGLENRATLNNLDLRNGLELMKAEARMSSTLSPYLPGTISAMSKCPSLVQVTATTVKFLVVDDDVTSIGMSGIRPYYVGYRYDQATMQLYRGEIAISSITSCPVVTMLDPTSTTISKVLVKNVSRVDSDNNGALDPVFAYTGGVLTVRLGSKGKDQRKRLNAQDQSTKIFLRMS